MMKCAGKTKDGDQCKNSPIKGKRYCYAHQNQQRQRFTFAALLAFVVTCIGFIANITEIMSFLGFDKSHPPSTIDQPALKTPFIISDPDPKKSRIAIADFEDRSDGNQKNIDPAGYIFSNLDTRIKRERLPIELIRLGYAVNENSALSVGKELGCAVLIWGWYDDLMITPRIERIRVVSCKPTDDPKSLSIVNDVELKINVTRNLPEQVSHLVLVVLAADRMAYKEHDLALTYLNEALKDFRDCKGYMEANHAYSLRGDIYRIKGEYDIAIHDYSCAISINSQDADAYYNRALVYRDKGDFSAAEGDFRKSLRIYTDITNKYPLDHKTRRKRAFVYLNLGNYEEAIRDFRRIINSSPRNSVAYRDLGYALRLKGDLDAAISELGKSVDIDPKDFDAYTNLGIAYRDRGKEGDSEKALHAFNDALKVKPDYVPALKHRGFIWISRGEYEKAIEDFKKVVSIEEKDPIAHRDLGYAYRMHGEYHLAIEHLTVTLQYNDKDADAYLNRARAYRAIQQNNRAIDDYRLARDNSEAESWINKAAKQELAELGVNE